MPVAHTFHPEINKIRTKQQQSRMPSNKAMKTPLHYTENSNKNDANGIKRDIITKILLITL